MDKMKNVLIADDIESIRFALKEYLKSSFQIFEAESGLEAVEILKNHTIHFIVSDIRMPGMGGLDLIRHVRENYPEIQYALMTAYNVNDYIEYARKDNIWNIIPKSSSLDLAFIKIMIEKNLSKDIFGVEKYFPGIKIQNLDYKKVMAPDFDIEKNLCSRLEVSDPEGCDKACEAI
ncbi:MAG: response regulator, partial [Spirochaetia bacterium]|nr:response regulator [Spirochaetia bacterium]